MKTAFLFVLSLLLVSPHGELDEQINALSEQIAQAPQRLELRIRRGELLRIHGATFEALSDFDYVLLAEPERHEVRFFKALALRDLKRHRAARRELDRFLEMEAEHPEGLRLSARLYFETGAVESADLAWAELFASDCRVSPDDVFSWLAAVDAKKMSAQERDRRGLAVLNSAKKKLGAAVVLELEAARREARLGLWQAFDERFLALKQKARNPIWFDQQQQRLSREHQRP